MEIKTTKAFDKQFKKLTKTEKIKTGQVIITFSENPYHKSLRNHPLKGTLRELRSINVTADIRIHYCWGNDEKTKAIFISIGTHAQLYG